MAELDYSNAHRAFVQAFMARPFMTADDVKSLMAAIFTVSEDRQIFGHDVRNTDIANFISTINKALSPFEYEIRTALHQITNERYYAFVNITSDPLTQLATMYTPDEISFIKRVLDFMFDTNNTSREELMAVSSIHISNLAKVTAEDRRESISQDAGTAQSLTMTAAEAVAQDLVHQGWFEQTGEGYYTLAPRGLMELKSWLPETYNDNEVDRDSGNGRPQKIKYCLGCKSIVTMIHEIASSPSVSLGTIGLRPRRSQVPPCLNDVQVHPAPLAWLASAAGKAIKVALTLGAIPELQTLASTFLRQTQSGSGLSNTYLTAFNGTIWDQSNWRLTTTVLDQGHYQSRPSIANGYIGISLAAAGPFFEVDVPVNGESLSGWPLFTERQTFATVAGFWDSEPSLNASNFPWLNQYGGESVISGIPHWGGIIVDLDDGTNFLSAEVSSETISNFTSIYDFKRGLVDWQYIWTPKDRNVSFLVEYQIFAHRLNASVGAVQLSITPSHDIDVTVANVIEGAAAVRSNHVASGQDGDAIYSSVSPYGLQNVTAYIYAIMDTIPASSSSRALLHEKPYMRNNASTVADALQVKLTAGETTTFAKYVGIASSDDLAEPKNFAKGAAVKAHSQGIDALRRAHIEEWREIFPEDSVDDFTDPETGLLPNNMDIIEAAIMAVVNPYYLLQNTITENERSAVQASIDHFSVSVGGLTSDAYGGMIFWDSDIWMQPGLVAAFPESSQSFTNYRVVKYKQALANSRTVFASSKNQTHIPSDAAFYPWTSGRFGNCTGTGPCFDYEYHLNGDIALEFINEWVTTGDDDFFNQTLLPIFNSIATGYASVVEKNGSTYTLTNMTDPNTKRYQDEYANHVDGGAYTMAIIGSTLRTANALNKLFNRPQNDTWNTIADNVYLARDPASDITMEYTTMNGSVTVKQADVVLLPYPLRYTYNYTQEMALRDLDFYALKQSKDGPGMTYAIFSIAASELSPSGCPGYTYSLNSYQPYIRGPWFQFSEQMIDDPSINGGTRPAFPFLTGHGGANQVVLFGYLGYRQVPDMTLHIQPNIPPQIPHIKFRTFYWRGWPIQAESNYTHTVIRRPTDKEPLFNADMTFANISIEVKVGNDTKYMLPVNSSITILNRQSASNTTTPDDIAQCRPAISSSSNVPGQFPVAAVDGMASTQWQPIDASALSALTIELPESEVGSYIQGFQFNWATSPPNTASVLLHDQPLEIPEIRNSSQTPQLPDFANATVALEPKKIEISHPYDPNEFNVIKVYQGNTTNVTLPEPIEAKRLVTLFVWGNQGLSKEEMKATDSLGATVADFVVLKDSTRN
ncbi:hypothetical protein KEM54_005165 [Ascosphaera aggregata]|nr:hypothetical protein KEM54_005165 [Ascosphaera aggregata]